MKLMNNVTLRGVIKNIERSHTIEGITFDKAILVTKRDNGQEDVINLRFKSLSNKYKENDEIAITGNLRSYSYKVRDGKNKVLIYVFTYFDVVSDEVTVNNSVVIDGRICKNGELRETRSGRDNVCFILANNLSPADSDKRLNSYIPCIAWGKLAKELSSLPVSTKLKISGQLHSREHKKVHPDGEVEFRVAHELLVKEYEVL